jgi:hypothetical protein
MGLTLGTGIAPIPVAEGVLEWDTNINPQFRKDRTMLTNQQIFELIEKGVKQTNEGLMTLTEFIEYCKALLNQ